MSTTHSVAMVLDTTTTMPVSFPVTMDKEDVVLDTVRSMDTDTVTHTSTPSKRTQKIRKESMVVSPRCIYRYHVPVKVSE